MKKKVSITISDESRAQLDWLKTEYMRCRTDVPLSQMIASAICIAYFDHIFEK